MNKLILFDRGHLMKVCEHCILVNLCLTWW